MNSYIQLPCLAVSPNPTVGVYISSTAGVLARDWATVVAAVAAVAAVER